MRLFLLWSIYYDNCDEWDRLLGVYQNGDDALSEQIRLEDLVPKGNEDNQYYRISYENLK